MIDGIRDFYTFIKNLNIGLILIFSVILLTLIGFVVLASASQSFSLHSSTLNKQAIWLVISLLSGTLATFVNLEKLRRHSLLLGFLSLALLLVVFIPGIGVRVNGALRWLDFGLMRLQVSDVAKLGLIFVLAHYLSSNQRYIRSFVRGFLIPASIIGCTCLLIILQPDFGTTFLCACVGFGVLFLAGVRLIYLIPSIMGGGLLFSIAVLLNPIRLKRLTSFLDVEGNKMDGAYQLWQGILAFAAGGVQGVGLGNGRQQMSFLPEAHTDFIFPIIGEELGLYFTSAVVILFGAIFLVGFLLLRRAPNLYSFCLAAGALLAIILQALINMGVVTGLLPTKGMSLPFISYGGSNLLLMFVLVGILLNCLRTWAAAPILKPSDL